jgi:hypothetical protein
VLGHVRATARRLVIFEVIHERASVFDVCGGARHHLLLFEGPTPDPRGHGRRHLLEGLLAQYAVDITIHDVSATGTQRCTRFTAPVPAWCG